LQFNCCTCMLYSSLIYTSRFDNFRFPFPFYVFGFHFHRFQLPLPKYQISNSFLIDHQTESSRCIPSIATVPLHTLIHHTHTRTHAPTHILTHTHTYTHTHIHTHTHTHTHTHNIHQLKRHIYTTHTSIPK